ncbi:helix-turn-helix domain-containing protein [Enterococcus hirae]|uniref:helix-turn-helix domain-containing protein n=1 Tax=Enterococcus hirae TaxID=1354 RepID=UPI001D135F27
MEENYINNNQFIEELKTKREQYDISQNCLAIACEISRAYLNRIENGKVQVTKKTKRDFETIRQNKNPYIHFNC